MHSLTLLCNAHHTQTTILFVVSYYIHYLITKTNTSTILPSGERIRIYVILVRLYVLQEDFPGILPQIEAKLCLKVNCEVVVWRPEDTVVPNSMLLHCVIVDTRLDHIALPQRVKLIQNRWGMYKKNKKTGENYTGILYLHWHIVLSLINSVTMS